MTARKQYYFFVFFLVLQIVLLQTGCKKEYSYEGGAIPVIHDTISHPVPINKFPQCSLCKSTDEMVLGKWNFKTGNSFICGTADGSGFIGGYDKKIFTFFGPSACSIDTGLVMTIYLPVPLDHDMYDVSVSQAAFYYYDHNAPKDIFISLSAAQFTATVKSYIYSTGIATGTFSGTVFKPNGDTAFVTDGNYKVKLK